MQIGTFRFETAGAEYSSLARTWRRRWAARQRHGLPEQLEDLGRGARTMAVTGTVWVRRGADVDPFGELRREAGLDAGEASPLHVYVGGGGDSSGEYAGRWVVGELRTRDLDLRVDGIPARVEFTLRMTEYFEAAAA